MAGQDMSQQFAQINQQNQQQFGAAPNNFGAPDFNGMNNMGNVPGNNVPPTKVKKSMSKGAIAGIIGGIAAVIALIVCGIIFLPKLFDPKKKVEDAFEKTFETEETVDLADKIQSDGGETSFTINLDTVMGEDINASLDYDSVINQQSKLINFDMTFSAAGDDIIKIHGIADEDNSYIQLVDIIDGYLSMPNKGFGDALLNAPLFDGAFDGMDVSSLEGLDLNYFEVIDTVETEGDDLFDEIWDKSTVKKKGNQTVTVNGNSIKAKQYEVTIPQDAIVDALDEVVQQAAESYDLSEFGLSSSDIRNTISAVVGGDIVAQVYIADKKVVRLDCSNSAGIISYNMWIDYDDTEVSGEFKLSAGGESISVKMDVKDPNGNPNGSITADIAGETVVVNFTSTINESSDERKADVKLDASYDGESIFTGSVSFGVNTKNTSVSGVDSSLKVYDVTKMSEDEANQMLEDNAYRINEWATKLMQNELVGSLFYTGYEDYIDYDDLDDYDDFDDYDGDDGYDYDYSGEETVLEDDDVKVEILGSLAGTTQSYGSTYFIDYEDESYDTYVEYELEDDYWYGSITEIAEAIYVPESDDYQVIEMLDESYANAMDLDDTQIYWSVAHLNKTYPDYDWGPDEMKYYRFVREVSSGYYLVADITLYPDSSFFNATPEELAQVVSSQCFSLQ